MYYAKLNGMGRLTGTIGLLAVGIFFLALIVFGSLHPDFNYLEDFVSKLGAKGQPNAIWFNLFGFLLAGLLMTCFGVLYGLTIQDKWVGILIGLFGLGFAFTFLPFDLKLTDSTLSKAHTVAITLGLATWLMGLARLAYNPKLDKAITQRANIAAMLLVVSILGLLVGFWSMPFTHRLVFMVVFGWTIFTSVSLLISKNSK
ncbi:DUF998 domain-containing protein [Echinicola sp. 20G]|uniref:DUF998 domain-containing protein n=1 Tax=Echinicola sp. 20G TaxID=2781961 RepID=UPI0019101F8D|nr:DUF998 domain-containing protein [Echinicola sp. 20G]